MENNFFVAYFISLMDKFSQKQIQSEQQSKPGKPIKVKKNKKGAYVPKSEQD